jgi:hypothetical protein
MHLPHPARLLVAFSFSASDARDVYGAQSLTS